VKMRPELFLQNFKAENFQTASELHGKQLRSWTHKSWKCVQKFFHKPHRAKTSEWRREWTANSFIFRRKNR